MSSDGTINVVTDSEDDDEQRAPATSRSRQLPSPSQKSATTPTGNGVLPSPSEPHPVAARNGGQDSSLSPQRDVISASGVPPQQPSK